MILSKARQYCARQERCRSEVHQKLIAWGEDEDKVEAIIMRLVKDGFLNEQRFAEHYAVSKFRQKGWGRVKIRAALRFKMVSAPCINTALAAIDDEEYIAYLSVAVGKLLPKAKGRNQWEREQRVKRSLLVKGFEGDLVDEQGKRI